MALSDIYQILQIITIQLVLIIFLIKNSKTPDALG